jgi:hypothetical protein
MAEDIRKSDSNPRRTLSSHAEIAAEAMRQSESALYTSTMLYLWLRTVKLQQRAVTLAPIVLTALAGFTYVKDWLPVWGVAMMAFLATLIPSVAEKMEIETHVDELKRLAAEYKSLQDRFRILAKITILEAPDMASSELTTLMDRMDVVRSSSITPPESYFEKAREKIKSGDYDFTVDTLKRDVSAPSIDPIASSR